MTIANRLEHTPPELFLLQLPLRITHPIVHINSIAAYIILKLFSLPPLILVQFFEIREALCWRLKTRFLTVHSFSQKLLC